MDPGIILAGIGLGLNLFQGASDSANADKIIEAQHLTAVNNTNFQNAERQSEFNRQQATIELNKANNENELQFREANDLAAYNAQIQANNADYNAKLAAYSASGEDYDTQIGINEEAERLALAQTQQKYNDQETALGFQNREKLLQQLGQYNTLIARLDQGQSAVDDALMRETIMETQALRDRDQQLDIANYGLEMIDEQAGEAQTLTELQNAQIQERVNTSRTGRDEQLMLLDQRKATDNLDTDNNIYRNQLQAKQQIALQDLQLAQQTDNLKGDLSDKELQTTQLLERLGIKNQGSNLSVDQRKALLENEYGTNELQTQQQIDQLTDTQRYNQLSRDTAVNDLATSQLRASLGLDSNVGDLNTAQQKSQLQLESSLSGLSTAKQKSQLQLESSLSGLSTAKQQSQLQLESSLSGLSTAEKQAQLKLQESISSLNIAGKQNQLNLQSNLSDLQTAAEANNSDLTAQLGKLSEEQQYNLFNRETNLGDLGFEFQQSRLQYEQNRAALSFKQEANRIEQLVRSGQIGAQGRRGISAARSINNIMSAAGRQSAQLTDAILRGDTAFKSQVLDIRRKENLAEKRFGIQSLATTRKAGEARTQADIKTRDIGRKKGFAIDEFDVNAADIERKKRVAQEEATISQADIKSRRSLAGKEAGISQADIESRKSLAGKEAGISEADIKSRKSLAGKEADISEADIKRQKSVAQQEFDITSGDLVSKSSLVDRKLGLQQDSTKRLIKDQKALLGRSKVTKDLKISQADAEKDQLSKIFNAETQQATDTLTQETTNTNRKIRLAGETTDLVIGQTQQSSTQAINDLKEGRALRNDQAYQQAVYVNDKFNNSFNALSAEQNLLAENLQQQLNSYSRETGKLNQQKDFARENYNVAYQAAQEVHDSAMRKYNDTAADVERERDRLSTQDQIIEDQYEASLQSAQQAKLASDGQIALDRYAADVTADKAVMPEPVKAPDPPKPITYPRTAYPELTDEHRPQLLPDPIKGQHSGVQFAGAIGNFASDLAGIKWG